MYDVAMQELKQQVGLTGLRECNICSGVRQGVAEAASPASCVLCHQKVSVVQRSALCHEEEQQKHDSSRVNVIRQAGCSLCGRNDERV